MYALSAKRQNGPSDNKRWLTAFLVIFRFLVQRQSNISLTTLQKTVWKNSYPSLRYDGFYRHRSVANCFSIFDVLFLEIRFQAITPFSHLTAQMCSFLGRRAATKLDFLLVESCFLLISSRPLTWCVEWPYKQASVAQVRLITVTLTIPTSNGSNFVSERIFGHFIFAPSRFIFDQPIASSALQCMSKS